MYRENVGFLKKPMGSVSIRRGRIMRKSRRKICVAPSSKYIGIKIICIFVLRNSVSLK